MGISGVSFGLTADLERQITREFSVHGGVKGRYTGPNVEAGVKYALIKSARTETIVTLLGDLHLNTNPVHFGICPQAATLESDSTSVSSIWMRQ